MTSRFHAEVPLPTLLALGVALASAAPAQAYDLLGDWPTRFKTGSGVEYGARGTIQYDTNRFSDDVLPNGTARFTDLQTWRRKETYLYARRNGVWELAAGYDFQSHLWVDAYFRLFNKSTGDFRVGQFKTPVGFEEGALNPPGAMSAEETAERGLRGYAAGERVVVTGIVNQLGTVAATMLPNGLVTRVGAKMMRKFGRFA